MLATDLAKHPLAASSSVSGSLTLEFRGSPGSRRTACLNPCVNNVTSAQDVARTCFCMDYDCKEDEERKGHRIAVII